MKVFQVPVGVSNRHIHLSASDLASLYGQGYEPRVLKELTQPQQYATQEVVTLAGPKGIIEGVRLLTPLRQLSQVEVSTTDCYKIGIRPVTRDSGDLDGSPGVRIIGPKGQISLAQGVIVAARHIHMSPKDAEYMGLHDRQKVSVEVKGGRGLRFDQVLIRVSPSFVTEMHVDTDEANAAGLKNGQLVDIIMDDGVKVNRTKGKIKGEQKVHSKTLAVATSLSGWLGPVGPVVH